MRLSDLLVFNPITIQTHDNPDPDALACAYGLSLYFKSKGKDVKIIYGGRSPIQKANLKLFIMNLGIDPIYVTDKDTPVEGLLLTADCQYGEGNVTPLKAENVAIIDHHQSTGPVKADMAYTEIRSDLGSCATLVWKMLSDEGFEIESNRILNTALYYGLMTDTGNFVEVHHPLDRDMMDELKYDKTMIYHLCNSNISLGELKIAGDALVQHEYLPEYRCNIITAEPCDPNILGLISDLALQVDVVDVCVVYNKLSDGYKFSVRSCVKEVHASDMAAFIAQGIGSGGGHIDKSGGFISASKLEREYNGMSAQDYFKMIIVKYFKESIIIHADEFELDPSEMKKYKKKRLVMGFVDPLDFLEMGDEVVIRNFEGDFSLEVDGTYIIRIGIVGEVFPTKKEKFLAAYDMVDEPYICETEYQPTIRRKKDGKTFDLRQYAKSCVASDEYYIRAKEWDGNGLLKVFTAWDEDNYMLGGPGDFIVCRLDDVKDVYVLKKDIMHMTYDLVEE